MLSKGGVRSTVACGALGALAAGVLLGLVTLGLNRHLDAVNSVVLLLWFAVLSAGAGAALGAVVAIAVVCLRVVGSRLLRSSTVVAASEKGGVTRARWRENLLLAGPVGAVLLLPDIGLSGEVVSDAILGSQWIDRARFILALVVSISLCLGVLVLMSRIVVRRWRWTAFAAAVTLVATGVVLQVTARQTHLTSAALPVQRTAASDSISGQPGLSAARAERVVVLNIDGLDPRVIDEMGREQLPFMSSMRDRGTFGPLQTEAPTLSPAIWTTMVTGLSRQQHGIRGFLYFHIPGLSQPIWEFPLHSGLNFKLLPWLERRLGAKNLSVQYRSNHRQVAAVWEILDGIGPIGVYRWRVTWPAEELEGFVVAEGVAQTLDELPSRPSGLGKFSLWPRDALEGLPVRLPGAGVDIVGRLHGLIEKYQTRLVIAGFSSVDGVQHDHGLDWSSRESEGRRRIEQRYQVQDQRLERLSGLLGAETDLIVVSDHGFSFEHGHHAQAPAGVFMATGPSFAAGKLVETLSIYDITPLLIDMFGVALSRELPGTQRGSYRDAVLAARSPNTVARYPTRDKLTKRGSEQPEDASLEDTKQRLRALGYIE